MYFHVVKDYSFRIFESHLFLYAKRMENLQERGEKIRSGLRTYIKDGRSSTSIILTQKTTGV